MGVSKRLRLVINLILISISILVWTLMWLNPGDLKILAHCQDYSPSATLNNVSTELNAIPKAVICNGVYTSASNGSIDSFMNQTLNLNMFWWQLIGWGVMVVAMMLPKLIIPIQYIYMRSLKRRRLLSSLLFVLGYITSWMVAGIFMVATIIGLNWLMPMSYIPAIAVGVIALIWQFSPLKQKFVNLGHEHRRLSAFGWEASRDALIFGSTHGIWCVCSGWALMLFPMLLPEGHNLAMIIVTFIMISEHLEDSKPIQWSMNFRLKLFKIILNQAKIRIRLLR